MTYRVDLTSHACRGYNRLPFDLAPAVGALLDGPLSGNPRRVGSALVDPPFVGVHRAKRGEYVVLYDIDDDAMVVRVRRVEHHRTVDARRLPPDPLTPR